jgi:hypothetical protein
MTKQKIWRNTEQREKKFGRCSAGLCEDATLALCPWGTRFEYVAKALSVVSEVSVFSSVPPGECQNTTLLGHYHFLLNAFIFIVMHLFLGIILVFPISRNLLYNLPSFSVFMLPLSVSSIILLLIPFLSFDSRHYQIYWVAVSLERGPLSPYEDKWGTTRKKSSRSGLENWD